MRTEVGAEGEDVHGWHVFESLPVPKAEQLVAAGLRDGPDAIEARQHLHVARMAGDALRPGDVRMLERNRVVENGGAATDGRIEERGKAGTLLFRK